LSEAYKRKLLQQIDRYEFDGTGVIESDYRELYISAPAEKVLRLEDAYRPGCQGWDVNRSRVGACAFAGKVNTQTEFETNCQSPPCLAAGVKRKHSCTAKREPFADAQISC
jgi:hypothetical protein